MFGRCLQITRKLERLLETKLQFKFRKTFGQSLFRSENWDVSFERFVGGCFLLPNWNVPPTSLMSSGTLGRAGLSSTDLCFHSTNVTICVSLLNQVPFLHWKTTNIPTGWSAGFSHPVCVASWSSPGGTKTGTLYGREREWVYENVRVRELTSLPHILLYIPRDTEDILYETRILTIYSHFYYEHNTVQFV